MTKPDDRALFWRLSIESLGVTYTPRRGRTPGWRARAAGYPKHSGVGTTQEQALADLLFRFSVDVRGGARQVPTREFNIQFTENGHLPDGWVILHLDRERLVVPHSVAKKLGKWLTWCTGPEGRDYFWNRRPEGRRERAIAAERRKVDEAKSKITVTVIK